MKVQYITTILKFKKKGEKTGWTYIDVPADVAQQVKPGTKKSFRVKGRLDGFSIKGIALLPMGDGAFIIPLNAGIRKGIGKRDGAMLKVELEEDTDPVKLDRELMECLSDEPAALKFFNGLPKSYQNYFSKWVGGAKTEATKAKRIAAAVNGLAAKQSFQEILRGMRTKSLT